MGDGETSMSIVGEVHIDTEYEGNPIKIRAVVANETEGILLGMPGLERCGIDVISSKKELLFQNGTRVNYITKAVTKAIEPPRARAITTSETKVISRRILLQAPSNSTWITPGESTTLPQSLWCTSRPQSSTMQPQSSTTRPQSSTTLLPL